MDELIELRLELFQALRNAMGEPEFTKWFVSTFREKLEEVKTEQGNRDRGVLRIIDTRDLSDTESFVEMRRRQGGL